MAEKSDTVDGSVRRIESELGLREGFLEGLKREDDWSFVIKIHALIEAAISYLLCKALGSDQLSDVLAHLDLSDKRAGKMVFVKALGLLDDADRRFISSLSELRNKLVHDVRKALFDLQAFVSAQSPDQFKNFVSSFNSFSPGRDVVFRGKRVAPSEVFRHDAKTALWWSAMVTLAIVYQKSEIGRFQREAERYSLFLKADPPTTATQEGPKT
jgi:hypothetical protein